jgi:hypothetical protein
MFLPLLIADLFEAVKKNLMAVKVSASAIADFCVLEDVKNCCQ